MSNKIIDTNGLGRFFENLKTYISGLLSTKQDSIADLDEIRQGASLGASAVQVVDTNDTVEDAPNSTFVKYVAQSLSDNEKEQARLNIGIDDTYVTTNKLKKVSFSGSYNDLTEKPNIPDTVTENDITNWGFTKNTGTYSIPTNGIPISDLELSVQESLGKADTAIQEHQNIKTINGQSIIGEGDVTIYGGGNVEAVDISENVDDVNPDYATKQDIADLLQRIIAIENVINEK